jgi:hypothetical protein
MCHKVIFKNRMKRVCLKLNTTEPASSTQLNTYEQIHTVSIQPFKNNFLRMKFCCLVLELFVFISLVSSQEKPITVTHYYPKDSVSFKENILEFDYNYESEKYGKTTMVIHCNSSRGYYDFIFKKKIFKLWRTIDYNEGGVVEIFNFQNHKWEHENGTWNHTDMHSKPIDTIVQSIHNLYAFILIEDHGGVVEKARFQDFGNEIYWPSFDYQHCNISDEDKDGRPEFYLSYMCESDGLDAKAYKQIIYSYPGLPDSKSLIKAKATAFYPAGNEDDVYHIEYESNWKTLSDAIKKKSLQILAEHKKIYEKN